MQDKQLLQLLKDRDDKGLRLLLASYGPLMRYIAKPILENPSDIEDCIQVVLMRVWERFDKFDESKGSLKVWISAVAKNAALDIARKQRDDSPIDDAVLEIPSQRPGPAEETEKNAAAAAVREALKKLPAGEQQLAYRHYWYRQTAEQIAAETGLSKRAVEGRLYRIRKKLAVMLKEYCNDR